MKVHFQVLGLLLTTVTLKASADCNGDTCDPFERCSEDELVLTPFRENATFNKIYNRWHNERFAELSGINLDADENLTWPNTPCGSIGGVLPIVDGDIAPDKTMPWIARIRIRIGGIKTRICTGSLISDKWVATVAHCLPKNKSEPVTVMLGRVSDVTGIKEDTFKEKIKAQLTIRHPSRKNRIYLHDFGLIKLDRSVTFSNRIRPICLPQIYDFLWGVQSFKECYIAGYGLTTPTRTGQRLPVKLFYLRYTILKYDECRLQWGWKYWYKHLCAIPTTNPKGSGCKEDSGGPLMCIVPGLAHQKRFYLMGVLCYGDNPCSTATKANVFTRMTIYVDWLKETVKSIDGSIPKYWTVPVVTR